MAAFSNRHGHAKAKNRPPSPTYNSWVGMLQRCTNPKDPTFARYGGRGITVVDRWKDFENFLADMGERPSKVHTLERKDNDGPYSPQNCIWATKKAQAANRRNSVLVEYDGRKLSTAEWGEITGTPSKEIIRRLKRGWSVTDALFQPRSRGKRHDHSE